MYGYGAPPPKVDPPSKKWDGVPRACIRKRRSKSTSLSVSFCGREDVNEQHEFMFTDAEHAVQHYRDSKHLRACEACVNEAIDEGAADGHYIAPMTTRGEKDNNR
jgi:hypothetical protein